MQLFIFIHNLRQPNKIFYSAIFITHIINVNREIIITVNHES